MKSNFIIYYYNFNINLYLLILIFCNEFLQLYQLILFGVATLLISKTSISSFSTFYTCISSSSTSKVDVKFCGWCFFNMMLMVYKQKLKLDYFRSFNNKTKEFDKILEFLNPFLRLDFVNNFVYTINIKEDHQSNTLSIKF